MTEVGEWFAQSAANGVCFGLMFALGSIAFGLWLGITSAREGKQERATVAGPLKVLYSYPWERAFDCLNPECTRVSFSDFAPPVCDKCGSQMGFREVVARKQRVIGGGGGERVIAEVKGAYDPPAARPARVPGWVCGYCGTDNSMTQLRCSQCGGGW
jgi:hypothetical protein